MVPTISPMAMRAEAGLVVGGYELARRIGRGGMAEVWKPGGSWRFQPGTTAMAFFSKDGLGLRTIP